MQDSWNRVRAGGPPAIVGAVLLLLASVGDVLVLAGVRFPLQGDQAPRAVLALLVLVLVLTYLGWVIDRPALNRPGLAGDPWFALLFGLSMAVSTGRLLLWH